MLCVLMALLKCRELYTQCMSSANDEQHELFNFRCLLHELLAASLKKAKVSDASVNSTLAGVSMPQFSALCDAVGGVPIAKALVKGKSFFDIAENAKGKTQIHTKREL